MDGIYDKKKVDLIIEKYKNEEELEPRDKIFYHNNINIRKDGILYKMNSFEIGEIIKCKKDKKYFIQNYLNLKLETHHLNIISNYENNRFNIMMSSRETGLIKFLSMLLLHELMFNVDWKISYHSPAMWQNQYIYDYIRENYKKLPFFMQCGVKSYTQNYMSFSASEIRFGSFSQNYHAYSANNYVFVGMSKMSDKVISNFYSSIFPTISNKASLLIASSPNGNNFFSKLCQATDANLNLYEILRIYWWELPNRDKAWKKDRIKAHGFELFTQEYDMKFYTKEELARRTKKYLRQMKMKRLIEEI